MTKRESLKLVLIAASHYAQEDTDREDEIWEALLDLLFQVDEKEEA